MVKNDICHGNIKERGYTEVALDVSKGKTDP